MPKADWEIKINPEIDGHAFSESSWQRAEGWLPVLEKVYQDSAVQVTLQIAAGETAAIIRVELQNQAERRHQIVIRCIKPGITASNPAWVQPDWDRDVLLAAYGERADRILTFMVGGDGFSVESPATLSQVWNLQPAEKRVGWIIRPYKAYQSQLPALRQKDWLLEFQTAKETWQRLINQAARVIIADAAVQNAFYAALADCFVMREPVTEEFVAGTPGTEKYRSAGSGEPAIVSIFLDQVGCIQRRRPDYRFS